MSINGIHHLSGASLQLSEQDQQILKQQKQYKKITTIVFAVLALVACAAVTVLCTVLPPLEIVAVVIATGAIGAGLYIVAIRTIEECYKPQAIKDLEEKRRSLSGSESFWKSASLWHSVSLGLSLLVRRIS